MLRSTPVIQRQRREEGQKSKDKAQDFEDRENADIKDHILITRKAGAQGVNFTYRFPVDKRKDSLPYRESMNDTVRACKKMIFNRPEGGSLFIQSSGGQNGLL
ncbi:hypothetical protein KQX54_019867 [Cotesia glomerata]|uniref:Uncharacterized protein n=1 Tax=Cotesia glomerata TaxID=32391 RepID=A0AAV7J282_COTGL|nr:hypothetical protein KQX54_019867 [Cotesia glomerata]